MNPDHPKPARKRPIRRGFFLRGLAVVLPAVLTMFVFVTVAQFADRYIAQPTNRVIYAALDGNRLGWVLLNQLGIDPYADGFLLEEREQSPEIQSLWEEHGGPESAAFDASLENLRQERETFFRNHRALGINPTALREAVRLKVGIWGGILIAAGLVLSVGYLASGFIGRSLIAAMDRALGNLPVVRSVYPHARQLVDFFLADNKLEFDAVVAARYPSDNTWSIGFLTGSGLTSLNEAAGESRVPVYIPSSPVPMTGYTIFLTPDQLAPLPLTVEQAFRLVVSAGVLIPEEEVVSGMGETLARLGLGRGEDPAPAAPEAGSSP